MNIKTTKTDNPLTFGTALTAGIGLVLMIVALGAGVAGGESSAGAVSLLFLGGLGLLVLGVGAWIAAVRPFEHFDDITQPKDAGYGHGSHDNTHAPELPAGQEAPALPSGGAHD
jgi:hypothetical protein